MTFVIVIHVIVCIGLVALVLVQRGRGGGLVESFSGVESMFGTKTSAFLTRLTTTLAVLFFISCLSLAFLSVRQSRSLLRDVKTQEEAPQAPNPVANQQNATEPNAVSAQPPAQPAQPQTQEKAQEQVNSAKPE